MSGLTFILKSLGVSDEVLEKVPDFVAAVPGLIEEFKNGIQKGLHSLADMEKRQIRIEKLLEELTHGNSSNAGTDFPRLTNGSDTGSTDQRD